MPWKPSAEVFDHYDSRLDDFRSRVGTLAAPSGQFFATVVLDRRVYCTQMGGRLWWRKFSEPLETFQGHIFCADGQYDDWVSSSQEEVLEDLADWRRGEFAYRGITYRVDWLDENASAQARKALLNAKH